jgi:hypothetical protein
LHIYENIINKNIHTLYGRNQVDVGPWRPAKPYVGPGAWSLQTTSLNLWNKSWRHVLGMFAVPVAQPTHGNPSKRATSSKVIVISPKGKWNVCISGRHQSSTACGDPADEARPASSPPQPIALAEEVLLRVSCSRECNMCQCNENTMKYYWFHVYIDKVLYYVLRNPMLVEWYVVPRSPSTYNA